MKQGPKKKNIALVAGGDSGEYVISVASAKMIRQNLDPRRYSVYTVLIRRDLWVHVTDDGSEVPVDKNDFSISLRGEKIVFDCAFITIHGTPGEDGRLQSYFELLGLPYTTAGVLPSALTFNKYYCNLAVAQMGFPVLPSVLLKRRSSFSSADILQTLGLPVFVKPNEGGSSLGMTFVKDAAGLGPAIARAFDHDDSVLVEKYMEGVELTCGVFFYKGETRALPVTEIISNTQAAYFDYQAKYTPGGAEEITPARISPELTLQVQETARQLYGKLNMFGLTRFDFIFGDDTLYFLEVNVTPGMTGTSIVPQQAEVAGIDIRELFTMIVEESLRRA